MSKDEHQKRGGFVPIGDLALDLPDVQVPARRGGQARHFTTLDQVTQLVEARNADPEIGFMARLLALCSLPRTDPKQRLQYVRRNGPYSLHMTATGSAKLPYGNIPRLLLAWVCSEAVRTQRRELILGDSLSAFMRELGLDSSSGAGRRRLRAQMDRLFNATVSLTYEHENGKRFVGSRIADRGEFWWDAKRPDQAFVVGEQNRIGREVLRGNYRAPDPARHEHPAIAQAVAARPRPVYVAHLSHVRAQAPVAAHVAATLSAVRRGPGHGEQGCSASFSPGLSA